MRRRHTRRQSRLQTSCERSKVSASLECRVERAGERWGLLPDRVTRTCSMPANSQPVLVVGKQVRPPFAAESCQRPGDGRYPTPRLYSAARPRARLSRPAAPSPCDWHSSSARMPARPSHHCLAPSAQQPATSERPPRQHSSLVPHHHPLQLHNSSSTNPPQALAHHTQRSLPHQHLAPPRLRVPPLFPASPSPTPIA